MLIPSHRISEKRTDWKAVVRTVAGWSYYYSGLFKLHLKLSQRRQRSVLILMLHRVLPANSSVLTDHLGLRPIITTQENLQALIEFLKKHFQFIALPDYINQIQKGEIPKNPGCIFTFDDGYRDFIQHAWPTLRAHNIPATMYLPTALIGTAHSFWWDRLYHAALNFNGAVAEDAQSEPIRLLRAISKASKEDRPGYVYKLIELAQDWPDARVEAFIRRLSPSENGANEALKQANALMDWNEVRTLHNSGVHFGSHTRHHLNLRTVTPNVLHEEVNSSKRDLESFLKSEVTSFSFPGGHMSDKAVEDVGRAGYTNATTTRRGLARHAEGPFQLRRLSIWDGILQDYRGRFSPGVFALNLTRADWF